MLNQQEFFNNLDKQFKSKLPFVVYSRPIQSTIKSWLQEDDALVLTHSFTESGFVFAPFDLKSPSVLFQQSNCKFESTEITDAFNYDNQESNETLVSNGKNKHMELVSKGLQHIKEGGFSKVVLSRVEHKEIKTINPITIFKKLVSTYKSAMVYCWYHPKIGLWFGATPELLFKIEGRKLTAISLAGTQAVQNNKEPNWSPKELEEQQIVTDFLEEQLKPFSTTISVSKAESVQAGKLWHLKSRLTSYLDSDSSLKDIIDALHPTPAVCGFPKENAKAFILEHEGYNREFYTGFLGELNLKTTKFRNRNRQNVENNAYKSVQTSSNFYVNLRCMQIKDGKAFIYVGGGVTRDSLPEDEYKETQNKAKTISTILG
jgi:isochorismate synthase